jgi:hypothetical protein
MNNKYTPEELEYIKGFDHGCDYIVEEIRKFAVQYKYEEDSMPFLDLLVHLKVQEK